MAKLIILEPNKTYATAANAVKAVEKVFPSGDDDGLRYTIQRTDDGRYFPVFIGMKAVEHGVHFRFHVVT
jgi:hypothetical protein